LLRKRRHTLLRGLALREQALGGHLALTQRRCGKPTCHCAEEKGHPVWSLSYSFEGRKRRLLLTEQEAKDLSPMVDAGRRAREGVMELLGINLELVRLWREQDRGHKTARRAASRGRKQGRARR
jgi:hypothetical protein